MHSDVGCFYDLLVKFIGEDLDVPQLILEAISEFGIYTFEIEGIGVVIFSDSREDKFVKIVTELKSMNGVENKEYIYENILRLNYGLNSIFGALTTEGELALTANFYYSGKTAEDFEEFMLKFFEAYDLYKNYANKLCESSVNISEKTNNLHEDNSSKTINMKLIV